MSFTEIVTSGINLIYEKDLDSQKHFLDVMAKTVRNMKDSSVLLEAKSFLVPNNNYMLDYFGPEATSPDYDMYSYEGHCIWEGFLVFPVPDVSGRYAGFAGFDFRTKLEGENTGSRSRGHYRYSTSSVFNRSKFLYCPPGVYEKAIREGYIVIVDGIFDMWSLHAAGINAGCLLGSDLSIEILFQLKFIKNIFVAEDNDRAGRAVYNELSRKHKSVFSIRQNVSKDADDIIKSDEGDLYLKSLRKAIHQNTGLVLRVKPKLY